MGDWTTDNMWFTPMNTVNPSASLVSHSQSPAAPTHPVEPMNDPWEKSFILAAMLCKDENPDIARPDLILRITEHVHEEANGSFEYGLVCSKFMTSWFYTGGLFDELFPF